MADIIKNVQGFLKIDEIAIDNNAFRLHYKVTAVLLVICSLLVTERQYLGDPINCIQSGIPASLMDTYCWIHSTYTVTNMSNQIPGVNVAYPGVAPPLDNYERKYHKYYQWVTLVLFLQAVMFYIPRHMWKTWEGNKMRNLVMKLDCPIMDEQVKSMRKLNLADYYIKNLRNHDGYAFRFFICEFLNFINVILQIYITDWFLGGEFTTYGSRVVEFNRATFGTRFDPMDEVFPKATKCTFHKYGPSGTIQRIDSLCILPINVLNEKIYIILWFWFIILAALTGIAMIYRIGTFFPSIRQRLLETKAQLADEKDIETVVSFCDIGDWFVLYQLAKNIDAMIFAEVISMLAEKNKSVYESNSLMYPTLSSDYEADTLPSKRDHSLADD